MTPVVRVLSANQKGTVGSYSLSKVNPGDFIIHRADKKSLSFLSGDASFVARQCDEKGNYISDKLYPSGKNTTLPILDKPLKDLRIAPDIRNAWFR